MGWRPRSHRLCLWAAHAAAQRHTRVVAVHILQHRLCVKSEIGCVIFVFTFRLSLPTLSVGNSSNRPQQVTWYSNEGLRGRWRENKNWEGSKNGDVGRGREEGYGTRYCAARVCHLLRRGGVLPLKNQISLLFGKEKVSSART